MSWERVRRLPEKSITRKLNADGKVAAERRSVVPVNLWFPEALGELVEEAIGLGRYGKTQTVLSVSA